MFNFCLLLLGTNLKTNEIKQFRWDIWVSSLGFRESSLADNRSRFDSFSVQIGSQESFGAGRPFHRIFNSTGFQKAVFFF